MDTDFIDKFTERDFLLLLIALQNEMAAQRARGEPEDSTEALRSVWELGVTLKSKVETLTGRRDK